MSDTPKPLDTPAAIEEFIQSITKPDVLRLHIGELTADQLRVAQAAARWAAWTTRAEMIQCPSLSRSSSD